MRFHRFHLFSEICFTENGENGKESEVLKQRLISLFIALSLTVSFYFLIKPTAEPQKNGDYQNFYYFIWKSRLSQHDTGFGTWKGRIAGPWLTGKIVDALPRQADGAIDPDAFKAAFAGYHAFWLFALFVVLIAFNQPFAGLMLYRSDPVPLYLPWDMPTMFFFTLAYLGWRSRKLEVMIPAILAGALFKETCVLPAMLLLFWQGWNRNTKAVAFGSTACLGFALTRLSGDMDTGAGGHHVAENLKELFTPHLRHVIFANGGTLALLLR